MPNVYFVASHDASVMRQCLLELERHSVIPAELVPSVQVSSEAPESSTH